MESKEPRLAIVGIGNTLAGDDAAGISVVRLLQEKLPPDDRLMFLYLEGDLYEISDYLNQAAEFIFVDAIAGSNAGEIVFGNSGPRAFAPSFHQTDIGAVMKCLQLLDYTAPFPSWSVCGITVDPPREICTKLTPHVEQSVPILVEKLTTIIERSLALKH
jgi:hydrogenase maturation protease